MNQTLQTIADRRSVRAYKDKPIPEDMLRELVEYALMAPSAKNLQPWHIIVARNQALLQEISDATADALREANERTIPEGWHVFHHAPVVLFLACDASSHWSEFDTGILSQTIALAAHSMGLSSCIVGLIRYAMPLPKNASFLSRLQVPEGYRADLCVTLGYGAQTPSAKPREKKVTWL